MLTFNHPEFGKISIDSIQADVNTAKNNFSPNHLSFTASTVQGLINKIKEQAELLKGGEGTDLYFFNKGKLWGETYQGWFTPSEEDHERKFRECY